MPVNDAHLLLVAMIILLGSGVFLRLVGKEKHRREKYLKQRFENTLNELKQQAEQKAEQVVAEADKVVIAKPVSD